VALLASFHQYYCWCSIWCLVRLPDSCASRRNSGNSVKSAWTSRLYTWCWWRSLVSKKLQCTQPSNLTIQRYRAQRYSSSAFSRKDGTELRPRQFAKKKGCVKDINIEKGGLMRVTTDRDHPIYKSIYCQRTSAERINSQAKAWTSSVRRCVTGVPCAISTADLYGHQYQSAERIRSINCSLIANIVRGSSLVA